MKVPLANVALNKTLFNFYVKNSKPQYESWSMKRVVGLKVGKPMAAYGFANVCFKASRSYNHEFHEFSLVDIPL